MNDFLHNLRMGQNKGYDRNRRNYDNNRYRSNDRPNYKDKRRFQNQSSWSSDQFGVLKKLLEEVTENQKRLAVIEKRRIEAEERKADAMETIAAGVMTLLPQLSVPTSLKADATAQPEIKEAADEIKAAAVPEETAVEEKAAAVPEETAVEEKAAAEPEEAAVEIKTAAEAKEAAVETSSQAEPVTPPAAPKVIRRKRKHIEAEKRRKQALLIINELRAEGTSYDKIARHLQEQSISTPSGRGVWRGQAVSKLYQGQN